MKKRDDFDTLTSARQSEILSKVRAYANPPMWPFLNQDAAAAHAVQQLDLLTRLSDCLTRAADELAAARSSRDRMTVIAALCHPPRPGQEALAETQSSLSATERDVDDLLDRLNGFRQPITTYLRKLENEKRVRPPKAKAHKPRDDKHYLLVKALANEFRSDFGEPSAKSEGPFHRYCTSVFDRLGLETVGLITAIEKETVGNTRKSRR